MRNLAIQPPAPRPVGMPPAVAALAAAARAISADVMDAAVNFLPSNGSVEVILRTREAQAAAGLAEILGCERIGWATDGRTQWLSAELGEYGDSFVIRVTGGHKAVCQCHPTRAA